MPTPDAAVSPVRTRDTRIDSLRGLMLAEMTLVHLRCPFALLSYELFGRVSPAAGFVFLSGLVAGGVYSRKAEEGAAAITLRCLRRAVYINVYHLAAFIALLALVVVDPRFNRYFQFALGQSGADALRTLGWFAVWAYQPDLFDILPLYGLFVLCMPVALLALCKGHGHVMLLVSLGVWALAQLGLGHIASTTDHFGFFQGDFNPFAWQFVFFSGLYFGHMHLYRGVRVVAVRPALVTVCLIVCLIGLTMRWSLLPWPAPFGSDGWLASKQNYGPAYLVNFLAFAYLVYGLGELAPRALSWPPLAFLGRHSIQVFSFHVAAVYLLTPVVWRVAAHGPWAYNALGAALVMTLFVPRLVPRTLSSRESRQARLPADGAHAALAWERNLLFAVHPGSKTRNRISKGRQATMSTVTAVVDAHVHIHPCYRPDDLLSNAYENLSAAQGSRVPAAERALFLLMTECAADDYFGSLYALAHGGTVAGETLALSQWTAMPTEESESVLAVSGERQLFIVAGRQVACREGLEVLVLGTTRRLPDGLPIREVLAETAGWGIPRVIPWGPGKWLFKRGRLLNQLLEEFRRPTLFLGDEGGRPGFWGYPRHFVRAAELGVRDLPGTDPLPFPHDVTKVGRMGFRLRIPLERMRPAASLLGVLRQPSTLPERFAVLESPLRFVRNQIGMQLRKHRLA